MAELEVSVVVTVLNESKSIIPLLSSLKKQTLKPQEIVVVDGGSSDDTRDKIIRFGYKHPKMNVHLIEEHGNISHGRNIGVENSRNNVIAMIDAGCTAKPNWIEKITEPFKENKHIVVAGFYEMMSTNVCQKAVAPFHGVTPREFDPRTFLPSARSIAFNKTVWKAVGGFDEHLVRAGEDTLFNYKVMNQKIPIVRRPDALVVWKVPATFMETVKKFYWYAKGDAQTGIWWHPAQKLHTHNLKIATIFIRYLVFLLLLIGSFFMPFLFVIFIYVFVGYTSWSIWKLHKDVDDFFALLLVPVIQIASDISVMLGFGSEFLEL
jgi:glycosyltransferase involved in cell wall biosynthesis